MKAARIHRLEGPDALQIEDVTSPAPGPGQVKLAVHAAGVGFADTLVVSGRYQHTNPLPFTPGMEAAGEILEVGPEVTAFRPGDRVMGPLRAGAWAEEAVCDAQTLVPMPSSMDYLTAAGFVLNYGTSHVALTHRVPLAQGQTLLVLGASGGVGSTAVEIGKALGATVIAAASSPEKLQAARETGADHVIDYRQDDLRQRVQEIAGGVDVVYDPVGGEASRQALRCLNYEGRLIALGFASGEIPQIAQNYLLVKNIAVVGYSWSSYRMQRPEIVRRSLEELCRWFSEGRIRPRPAQVFPLARIADALRAIQDRKAMGKIVLAIRD